MRMSHGGLRHWLSMSYVYAGLRCAMGTECCLHVDDETSFVGSKQLIWCEFCAAIDQGSLGPDSAFPRCLMLLRSWCCLL
jgi:hypothetical protein